MKIPTDRTRKALEDNQKAYELALAGNTIKEIAETMNVTPATVRHRVKKHERRLKRAAQHNIKPTGAPSATPEDKES